MRHLTFAVFIALSSGWISAAEWQIDPVPSPAKPAILKGDGPLWYRCFLKVDKNLVDPMADPKDLWRESMTLALQDIQGPYQVTLNGVKILEGTQVADGAPHRFKVAKGILKKDVYNVLAIRLEGKAAQQGLRFAPVFGGYHDELVLDRGWQAFEGTPDATSFEPVPADPGIASYTEKDWRKANTVLQAPDEPVRGKQVTPDEALKKLKTPDDLVVESLLHEPAVAQPTHISFDSRGRMWVSQYRQYPYPAGLKMISRDAYYRSKYDRVPPAPPYHDKGADIISVHEDRDGDGVYETQKNLLEGLNMANAALQGHGGIWVMHTPYLLFYPDADQDDVPDGDPEVRLAGFGLEDTHSTANGLAWGPDGWLYGAQGSTVSSHITRPGVDKSGAQPRYLEGCAVWRYHPKTKEFEIFADGSGNTFGLHFDSAGRLFSGHNGGNTRGWHHIQEGDYLKQGVAPDKFGPPTNPYAFGQMPHMNTTNPVPRFSHNIIMMEGTALPATWKGKLLGADPLHQRLVAASRDKEGSTFITTDTGFPVEADDVTFRPVYLVNAPDGSVMVGDFREEYIAHGQNYQGQIDPSSGRIYRLRGKESKLEKDINLHAKSSAELVTLLAHPNHWHRHTAVRVLAERRDKEQTAALRELLFKTDASDTSSQHPALESLWVLYQTGDLTDEDIVKALTHPATMVRYWAIRFAGEDRELADAVLQAVIKLTAGEADAEVRSQVLSTARRLQLDQALALTQAVLNADKDVNDPFIPLMAWYVLESHCKKNATEVISLFENNRDIWQKAIVRQHITPRLMRRFAAAGSRQEMLNCARLLQLAPAAEDKAALMQGFEEAFKGRSMPPLPDELTQVLAQSGKGSLLLRVRQGDEDALKEALALLQDPKADVNARLQYARVFGEVAFNDAVATLLRISQAEQESVELRKLALASLMSYDQDDIGAQSTELVKSVSFEVRDAALNLLSSRPHWALLLISAVAENKVPADVVKPDLLARLRLHQDKQLVAQLNKLYPAANQNTKAKESLRPRIEQVREILSGSTGDPYAGEPIYMERCATCHRLFHKGGNVGPNLTSYQREDLGTMLVSIIDPNAEIREGYINQFVTTKDGRTLGGFLADQDANVIVLRGFDGNDVTLQRKDITTMQGAGASLMPEGLVEGLSDKQLRDLFAYLRISQPISK